MIAFRSLFNVLTPPLVCHYYPVSRVFVLFPKAIEQDGECEFVLCEIRPNKAVLFAIFPQNRLKIKVE
jgi:hypothetical protein